MRVGGRRNAAACPALACCVSWTSSSRGPGPGSALSQGRGPIDRIEGARLAADIAGMAKKPEPPNLFWLTYRHPDGSAAGVVVIESRGLLHARLVASLSGADRGLEFVSGHPLDPESAGQIPTNMIGRLLDDGDLRKLHRMLIGKKPPEPSVRRGTATKRRMVES
jgi:hypothetical protein